MKPELPEGERTRVTLKLATSLDGRIATASGESRWITSEAAREIVHRLRAEHDGVLVGSETVLADDPELTARMIPAPTSQPVRIVADGRGRIPPTARLFASADLGHVAIATLESTDLEAAGWPAHPNVHYWMLPADAGGRGVSLPFLLAACAGSGLGALLVEGGGALAASFVRAGLVDRIEWFRAPKLLGAEGRPCIGDLDLGRLADAPAFRRIGVREAGPDLWESYERV